MKLPDEENFLRALIVILKQKDKKLATLLENSKLSFRTSSIYSPYVGGRIFNAYATTAIFAVAPDKFAEVNDYLTYQKSTIIVVCRDIMPEDSGYEITDVKISVSLEDLPQKANAIEDLENIANKLPPEIKEAIIPEDIMEKAKEMASVYLYTYCAENSLRAFILKVAQDKFSSDYLTKLNLSRAMQKKIEDRKTSLKKKKWMSVRGDSDLFYLDFEDLGKVIANNWSLFEPYFDSYEWISTNIKEIADCRNPVAHHSYLHEHERQVIRLNFIKILKQISETFK